MEKVRKTKDKSKGQKTFEDKLWENPDGVANSYIKSSTVDYLKQKNQTSPTEKVESYIVG